MTRLARCCAAFLLVLAATAVNAQQETILHTFSGPPDASDPTSALVADKNGNYYGTTPGGGAFNFGTVYEISASGEETVLYSFTGGADGGVPTYANLIFDAAGNLYGTTFYGGATGSGCGVGGSAGCGTVFELSLSGGSWAETVLYSFDGAAGVYPESGLTFDPAGNLYGTASVGSGPGAGWGVVFELSQAENGWQGQIIYSMVGFATAGGVTMDVRGNIYGASLHSPKGSIFELSPDDNGGWNSTVLHTFTNNIYSTGKLVVSSTGTIYGTTITGGAGKDGTVFALSLNAKGKWVIKIWHAFTGGSDGNQPYAGVVFDAKGNMYGTTTSGGTSNMGTVFELVRGPKKAVTYSEKILWSFNSANGSYPFGGLVVGGEGSVYGTAEQGGADGRGVVFAVSP